MAPLTHAGIRAAVFREAVQRVITLKLNPRIGVRDLIGLRQNQRQFSTPVVKLITFVTTAACSAGREPYYVMQEIMDTVHAYRTVMNAWAVACKQSTDALTPDAVLLTHLSLQKFATDMGETPKLIRLQTYEVHLGECEGLHQKSHLR